MPEQGPNNPGPDTPSVLATKLSAGEGADSAARPAPSSRSGSLPNAIRPVGICRPMWTRFAHFQTAPGSRRRSRSARSSRPRSCGRHNCIIVSHSDLLAVRQWASASLVASGHDATQNSPSRSELIAEAEAMRAALADGPRTVKELGEISTGTRRQSGPVSPPRAGAARPGRGSKTWADRLAPRRILGRSSPDATEEDGLIRSRFRAYLRARRGHARGAI